MPKNNFERMIKLAEEFFENKNDPEQISMSEKNMMKLRSIHPNTLNEKRNKNGPIAWLTIIPTSKYLMKKFISKQISEKELLEKTKPGVKYDALYLCSVLVLPEFRTRGVAKKLIFDSIKSIMKEYQIKYLFCWVFSKEGRKLAKLVANKLKLPLYFRSS